MSAAFAVMTLAVLPVAAQTAASAPDAASQSPAGNASASASDSPSAPERQPQALKALSTMAVYLRSLQRFEVDADSATDAVLDSGQTVSFLHHTVLKVQRPNRLSADITGSRGSKGMIYDGSSFTIFNSNNAYYSKNPAPSTLGGLVNELADKYGIETPLVDLFLWGNGKNDDASLTSALFVGAEKVGTRWCNHYAYQQSEVNWELWLQTGSHPLPCRMVIVDLSQDAKPRHVVTYHWTLNPTFAASTFIYRPPANAKPIALRPVMQTPYGQGE